MDKNALKAAMVRKGYNGRTLAKVLEISETAMYDKLNGAVEFKLSETTTIIRVLELSYDEARLIFYPNVE